MFYTLRKNLAVMHEIFRNISLTVLNFEKHVHEINIFIPEFCNSLSGNVKLRLTFWKIRLMYTNIKMYFIAYGPIYSCNTIDARLLHDTHNVQ